MVLGHDITAGQRTQDVHISQDISFDTMLLKKVSNRGLKEAGFLRPSPVQLRAIPLGKCGFDLLLEAKSGTGKTAVFTVIALEKLDLKKGLQAIILAPTREIASQITDVIAEIGCKYKDLNVAVVIGGLPVKDDIAKFKKNVHIVVGSPGRLRHLIQDKYIDVSSVRLFVLDEADKLMESSFLSDINYIFSLLPKQKQVIMSSATYSEEAKSFVNKYVQNAIHVCPDSNSVLLGITQKVVTVPHNTNIVKQTKYRYEEVKKILNEKQFKQCLIFCNYQVRVGEVHRMLCKDKWPAQQLYGQQDQSDRLDALKTLQEYKCRILVSTDLAARGIDASNVDIVINFEPPYEWETYLHRIGRAGRYGSYGSAITILSEGKETEKFKETLALTNIPFDLQYLWDDKSFHLSVGDSNCSSETNDELVNTPVNNDSHRNDAISNDILWKALTSETKEKDNLKPEISSFNEICNAFKASSMPNIETFTDLMDSFNTNTSSSKNKEDSEYKHVEVVLLTQDPSILDNNTHKTSSNGVNGKDKKGKERYLTERMEKDGIQKNVSNSKSNVGLTKNHCSSKVSKNNGNTALDSDTRTELVTSGDSTQDSFDDIENRCDNTINSFQCEIKPGTSTSSECYNVSKLGESTHEQLLHTNKSREIKINNSNNNDKQANDDSDSGESSNDQVKQALRDAGLPTAFGKKTPKRKYNKDHKYKTHTHTKDFHGDKIASKSDARIKDIQPNTYESAHDIDEIENSNQLTVNQCYQTQLLVDSDFSTGFEKNKVKTKNMNKHCHKNINKIDQSFSEPFSRKTKNNCDINRAIRENKSSSKAKNRSYYSNKSTTSDEDIEPETCYVRNQASQFVNDATKNASNKTLNYQTYKSKKPSRNNNDDKRGRQFDLWYSRLEQQTHFIQQTLYMEAMRSLNHS